MLDQLTTRLARVVKTMRGEARLTEENMQAMLRDVRVALLEADVALPVVRDFIARIKEKALGEDVIGSLTPGQALVGVVQRELTTLMGGDLDDKQRQLNLATQPPAVILLAGLQGAGKTTTAGNLRWLKDGTQQESPGGVHGRLPASCNRTAQTGCRTGGRAVLPSTVGDQPLDIAARAIDHAKRHYFDVLIVDTASRLAIDEAMMQECSTRSAVESDRNTLCGRRDARTRRRRDRESLCGSPAVDRRHPDQARRRFAWGRRYLFGT